MRFLFLSSLVGLGVGAVTLQVTKSSFWALVVFGVITVMFLLLFGFANMARDPKENKS